jgi:FemAB-related protein (PEP-CTERM system-associated)
MPCHGCRDATFSPPAGGRDHRVRLSPSHAFLYAEDAGRIVGVLPLAHVDSWVRRSARLAAVRGVRRCRGRFSSRRRRSKRAQALRQRLEGTSRASQHRRAIRIADADLYVTFRKEILPDVEANMLAIPRKQRAMVRKGAKTRITSEIDRTVDRFYALFADNVHRQDAGAPKRYFEALKRCLPGLRSAHGAGQDGARCPRVMSFYFGSEVLPYYAGDCVEARDLAANDFKYWELMRRACERGLKTFDYGRSKKDTGSYSFKKNWGFLPQPLHYEYRLYRGDAIPQNNPANPKYRAFIGLWRRLPRGVADRLGPHIVRNLG